MNELTLIQKIAVWGIPVLFAITVHEVSHGWVASKLGDKTALMLGRVTLNPFKHIDPLGTIIVPLILLTFGGFIFGWAKPVPVNWTNLHKPRRDMAIVAAAGPISNLLMALFWGLMIKLGIMLQGVSEPESLGVIYMGQAGVLINLVLMFLNFLPIPPLDGSRVVSALLSPKLSYGYSQIEPFGFFIILALLVTGILGNILTPLIHAGFGIIATVFGLR